MGKTFSSLKELEKFLESSITKVLKENVGYKVVEVMQDNIQNVVYNSYSPTEYERREHNGGLIDSNNIEVTPVGGDTIVVENITPPNLTYKHDRLQGDRIDYAVESGRDYDFFSPGSRPFIESTRDDLKKNGQHVEAMKKGLLDLNLNVE